jgi:hypothetical protein
VRTDPDWLDTIGVAEMLCVERSTVWSYAKGRLVPDDYLLGRPLWRVSTVVAYVDGLSEQGKRDRERRIASREQPAA